MSRRRDDPRTRATAHRPLLRDARHKRALSHVGGPIEQWGDRALSEPLAAAFAVRAGERDATLTHPFHAYPARLHPEVARRLVALAAARASSAAPAPPASPTALTVLDPFCGSGTVLVEAMVAGHTAIGTDLSTLAIELARLKTRITTAAERKAMVEAAHETARAAAAMVRAHARPPVPRDEVPWFAYHTLVEVASLTELIDRTPPGFLRDAQRMLLSSVLVKVSRQASDSDTRPVDKHVAPGAAVHFFARKSLELDRCLAALARATPRGTPPARAELDDATRLASVSDASVDAVVTSPPYANTYDYVAHHARRYAWLRLDPAPLEAGELGAARWFAEVPEAGALRFARELSAMCAAFARVLRPGGVAFVVMADAAVGDAALDADEALAIAARASALTVAARVSQARPTFDRASSRAFARRPKREHLIALTRSTAR